MGYTFTDEQTSDFTNYTEDTTYAEEGVDLSVASEDSGVDLTDPDVSLSGLIEEFAHVEPGSAEFDVLVQQAVAVLDAMSKANPDDERLAEARERLSKVAGVHWQPIDLTEGDPRLLEGDPALLASAAVEESLEWAGVLGVEGEMTGDGRVIDTDALSWDTPLPLRYVSSDVGEHKGAQVVGWILSITRMEDGRLWGEGNFDSGSDVGREAARQVIEGLTNGISMDLDDVTFEVRVASEMVSKANPQIALADEGQEQEVVTETDEDGRVTVQRISPDDEVRATTSGRLRAATIVAIPAFYAAKIYPTINPEDMDDEEFGLLVDHFAEGEEVGDEQEDLPKYNKHVGIMYSCNARFQSAVARLSRVLGASPTTDGGSDGVTPSEVALSTSTEAYRTAIDDALAASRSSLSMSSDLRSVVEEAERLAAALASQPAPSDGTTTTETSPSASSDAVPSNASMGSMMRSTNDFSTAVARFAEAVSQPGTDVAASSWTTATTAESPEDSFAQGATRLSDSLKTIQSVFSNSPSTHDSTSAEFNWVDDVGGLPTYIRRISKHLRKKGMTESHAIATAVNVVKKMCASGDLNFPGKQSANPISRAQACAAVASWEAKKKASKATAAQTVTASAFAFNPKQLRVPKGSGRLSGRWIDMPDSLADLLDGVEGADKAKGILADIADTDYRDPEYSRKVAEAADLLDGVDGAQEVKESLDDWGEIDTSGVDLINPNEDDKVIKSDAKDDIDLGDTSGVKEEPAPSSSTLAAPLSQKVMDDFAAGGPDKGVTSAWDHIVTGEDGVPRFSEERQKVHEKIIEDILGGATPVDSPTYRVMGGGPAAGKSTMEGQTPQLSENAAVINADDIKAALPEYATTDPKDAASYTHEESSYVAKKAQEIGFGRGLNITLDGTGDSGADSMRGKIRAARDAGYRVEGYYVTIDTEEAVRRSDARGERTGRVVPHSVIRGTHQKVSQVLPSIIDDFDDAVLYDTRTDPPTVIAKRGKNGGVDVLDEQWYEDFIAKGREAVTAAAGEPSEIDVAVASSIYAAVANGATPEQSPYSDLPGFDEVWATAVEEYEAIPEGMTMDLPNEIPDEETTTMTASSLTAGAGPKAAPSDWFRDPELTSVTPLTVTKEGRVYGHLAAWGTCHTSHTKPGECVTPPSSPTDYAYFRTGGYVTSDGEEISVGPLTIDTLHAGERLGANATVAHYEDTGTTVAYVAAGEDAFGIWVAGTMAPGTNDQQATTLRATPLSGDWRRIGTGLELVAALAVNVPGFPIPRPKGLVASGHTMSLVASGMVAHDDEEEISLTYEDISHLKSMANRERSAHANDLRRRARSASAAMFKHRLRGK